MNDVEPWRYPTVLREMIRHENDVTNHRIMWLLICQGLIANAYVSASTVNRRIADGLATVGVLITFSTYVLLYKSYQARGYLEFLGRAAKDGRLPESLVPLMGWPHPRVKDWRRGIWLCSWLGRVTDLLEPYVFLPAVLLLSWVVVLARRFSTLEYELLLPLCAFATIVLLAALSMFWVSRERRDESEALPPAQ